MKIELYHGNRRTSRTCFIERRRTTNIKFVGDDTKTGAFWKRWMWGWRCLYRTRDVRLWFFWMLLENRTRKRN